MLEGRLLYGLTKSHKNNHVGALEELPPHQRSMYLTLNYQKSILKTAKLMHTEQCTPTMHTKQCTLITAR